MKYINKQLKDLIPLSMNGCYGISCYKCSWKNNNTDRVHMCGLLGDDEEFFNSTDFIKGKAKDIIKEIIGLEQ